MSTKRIAGLFATLFLSQALLAQQASAHIDLNFPAMRNGDEKVAPCEGKQPMDPADPVTILEPGSTLEIKVEETIPHPGHFRVMFDADTTDGEDFPIPMNCDDVTDVNGTTVLGDYMLPAQGQNCPKFHTPSVRTPDRVEWNLEVTLPNVECENCAIQVIQVMTDRGTWTTENGTYYRCANVKLRKGAPPIGDVDAGVDSEVDAGTGGGGGSDDGNGDGNANGGGNEPVGGGCSTGGQAGGFGLLALVALFAMRRRRQG